MFLWKLEFDNNALRLGILLSGRGSNFLAIAASIREGRLPGVEIAVVISNIADAPGIAAAQQLGLSTVVHISKGRPRADHDADMIATLTAHRVDLICLAGYMRLLSPEFIAAFPNRILNIHPSLLPAFPGLDAQSQAFDYGVKVAGCTVHFVDEHLDHGVIVLQRAIPVLDTDDAALPRRPHPRRRAPRLHRSHRPRRQQRIRNPRPPLHQAQLTQPLPEGCIYTGDSIALRGKRRGPPGPLRGRSLLREDNPQAIFPAHRHMADL